MSNIKDIPQDSRYPFIVPSIGDKVTMNGYSDRKCGTVVKVSPNGKRVSVQRDSANLKEGQKPEFVVGGYAGHCTNQSELEYDVVRDEEGEVYEFSLRVWRGRYCWTKKGCSPDGKQDLSEGWHEFYDYNF